MEPQIRNVAIIAHVDHGKTTLVDHILRQCDLFKAHQEIQTCFLDSNDLERERGITILAKNISVLFNDTKINLIDTPGHSDFGGEVERVLKMADGVLLLVDAYEGPMPQTRFVLRKALEHNLLPLVVINKMDRPLIRPDEVLNEIFDLFIDLGATEEQLEFPVLYASGKEGWVVKDPDDPKTNVAPLLDAVVKCIPGPDVVEGPAQLLVTSIEYSEYVGRLGIGRLVRGPLRENEEICIIGKDQTTTERLRKIFIFSGLGKAETKEVVPGDICAIQLANNVEIGDTIAAAEQPDALPRLNVDRPTISMLFTINNSPFFGKSGKYVTSRHVRERLFKELKKDMALKIEETSSPDELLVFGRGILHLAILIETMRREGYELQVGQPRVLYREIDGVKNEPIEELVIDVRSDMSGKVMELLGPRRSELKSMENRGDMVHLVFEVPARGLFGVRSRLLTATSGEAVMYHRFSGYAPFTGDMPRRMNGVILAMLTGKCVAFGISNLQDRGQFFINPGVEVYEGQIIGAHNKQNDIVVNVLKAKKLTNMRASGSDKALQIAPAIQMTLEDALEFIGEDEYVEITPDAIRMRKILLKEYERKRAGKQATANG